MGQDSKAGLMRSFFTSPAPCHRLALGPCPRDGLLQITGEGAWPSRKAGHSLVALQLCVVGAPVDSSVMSQQHGLASLTWSS